MPNKPKTQVIQGSPAQIVEGIFKGMITPMYSQMSSVSEHDADEFAFCLAGTAAAGFMACADDLDSAKELLLQYIESMYQDIKSQKQGVGILAKPQGSA